MKVIGVCRKTILEGWRGRKWDLVVTSPTSDGVHWQMAKRFTGDKQIASCQGVGITELLSQFCY